MKFDQRWLVAIAVLIIGFIIFSLSRKKEIFLTKALVFLMPFAIGFYYVAVSKEEDAINACDVILFFLYVYWYWDTNGFKSQRIYFDNILFLYMAVIVWALIPVGIVISPSSLLFAAFSWIKCLFLFFYLYNRVKTKEHLIAIVDILIIILFIQGLIGFLQKTLGHTLGLDFLGERASVFLRASHARARGTLGFPNQYAAYIIMLIPLAVTMFVYSKKGLKKIWYSLVIVLSTMGWISSLSRSAWLGLAGALVIIFIFMTRASSVNLKSFFLLVFIVAIISFVVIFFADQVMGRIQKVGAQPYRWLMMRMAFQLIGKHPIFGVGLWNYQFHSYGDFRYWHAVHNMILRLGSELGIPGLILFLSILFKNFKNCITGLKFKDRFLNYTALGVMGGQLAFLLAAMFNPQFQHYRHKFLFWFLIGLAVAVKRIGLQEAFLAFNRRNKSMNPDMQEKMLDI